MRNLYKMIIVFVMVFNGFHLALSSDEKMKDNKNDQLQKRQAAVFAGGCFWCTEADFEKVDGVDEVISGYTGGHVVNPEYGQVSKGVTGHIEAVKVIYDPERISYEDLLKVFWKHIDPTDPDGQFVDRGAQYRGAIFYANDREKLSAENSKKRLEASGRFKKPIVTDILQLGPFYPAEDYHQDYYKKNPVRYHWYRSGSGRDRFLENAWADMEPEEKMDVGGVGADMKTGRIQRKTNTPYSIPDDNKLRQQLTAMQYNITRQNGTEPPYKNEYWNNHDAGIYVDIVSGEPLFSSLDKYDSGTGWPSFTRPLEPDNIVEHKDRSFFMVRTEVRSKYADSHLGHVFDDGPEPTGLRYCINSAALRFIPKANLEKEGYENYLKLFE